MRFATPEAAKAWEDRQNVDNSTRPFMAETTGIWEGEANPSNPIDPFWKTPPKTGLKMSTVVQAVTLGLIVSGVVWGARKLLS